MSKATIAKPHIESEEIDADFVCTQSHVPNAETRRAIKALEAGKGKVYTGSTKNILDRIQKGL